MNDLQLEATISGSRTRMIAPPRRNGSDLSFPRDMSVVDFFGAQARARPEALAVEESNRLLTYRELDLQSNRVANELRRYGLPLEHPVTILLNLSCEYV